MTDIRFVKDTLKLSLKKRDLAQKGDSSLQNSNKENINSENVGRQFDRIEVSLNKDNKGQEKQKDEAIMRSSSNLRLEIQEIKLI